MPVFESPEQGMRQLTGQTGESPESVYAKFFSVTHSDMLLENLVRTKLISNSKSGQLEESLEATVRKGLTDSGTSSATGANTLTDATKHWATNEWVGATAVSAGDTLTVTSNTATVLTGTWSPAQPGTGAYTLGFAGNALTTEAQEEELLKTSLAGWS
jgi:hypothetical protein